MNTARIAELLKPFLVSSLAASEPSGSSDSDHSEAPVSCLPEPAKSQQASPEPDRWQPPVLSPIQLQYISTYIDILLRWNARINLTAIRDPEDIVTRHFGESLFAASHLFPVPAPVSSASSVVRGVDSTIDAHPERKEASARADVLNENLFVSARSSTLADIGSGAGFPGLPIKLWAPHVSVTLIESNHKKAAFLREVTRAITLTDVNIQTARAKALTGSAYDVVTLRAVERFESVLLTAAALVAPAGRLALLIGASQDHQARSTLPGFTWSEPIPVPHSRARVLLIGNQPSNKWTRDQNKRSERMSQTPSAAPPDTRSGKCIPLSGMPIL
jgi:16S rRNA (guanine527-N7)-methyltransferase